MTTNKQNARLARVCLILFVFFLVWGLYFKFGMIDVVRDNFNPRLTLMRRFRTAFSFSFRKANFSDMLLNTLVTAPLGVLLPEVRGRVEPLWQGLTCCLFSLSIEILQLFTAIGGFAMPDLICNTLGYFVGLLFYRQVFLRLSGHTRTVLLAGANAVVSACVTFAALQMLHLFPEYVQIVVEWIGATKDMN